jgi:polyisoprenoid-binding protein YceI
MSTQTIEQRVPAGSYVVDPVHSSIGFSVTHNGVSAFRSGFRDYEARFEGGDAPRLSGSVEVASIDIAEEQFKGHILSPDFFDAENHPRLEFSSTELNIAEDGSVKLSGELEIRGHRQKVEAGGRFAQLGEDAAGGARVGLSLEAAIDRRGFGLDWQMELPSGGKALGYEVSLVVELELVAEAG